MSRYPEDYLHHILQETAFILETSQGLTAAEFYGNETLKRAYGEMFGNYRGGR